MSDNKGVVSSNEHTKRVIAAARKAIAGQRIAVGSPLHLLEMLIKIVEEAPSPETFDIPVQRVVNAAGTAAYDTPQIVECNEDGSLLEPPTQKANERPKCSGTMGCHVHWSGWPTHHPNCSDHPNNRSVKSEEVQR